MNNQEMFKMSVAVVAATLMTALQGDSGGSKDVMLHMTLPKCVVDELESLNEEMSEIAVSVQTAVLGMIFVEGIFTTLDRVKAEFAAEPKGAGNDRTN